MNERIKEFRFKAAEYANEQKPLGLMKWNEIRDAKFAELIVKECLTFVEPMPGSGDIDDLALEAAYNQIKEHFGVEE